MLCERQHTDVINNLSVIHCQALDAIRQPGSKEHTMYHGIINGYKEPGYTSHDVVARLRGTPKAEK